MPTRPIFFTGERKAIEHALAIMTNDYDTEGLRRFRAFRSTAPTATLTVAFDSVVAEDCFRGVCSTLGIEFTTATEDPTAGEVNRLLRPTGAYVAVSTAAHTANWLRRVLGRIQPLLTTAGDDGAAVDYYDAAYRTAIAARLDGEDFSLRATHELPAAQPTGVPS
jgi:hypothetical protein